MPTILVIVLYVLICALWSYNFFMFADFDLQKNMCEFICMSVTSKNCFCVQEISLSVLLPIILILEKKELFFTCIYLVILCISKNEIFLMNDPECTWLLFKRIIEITPNDLLQTFCCKYSAEKK